MLDEEHEDIPQDSNDSNIYSLGRMGDHNVGIACLPKGQPGLVSAATVASQMKSSFPSLRFGSMVGIGGGVPSGDSDIRLGDVVIGQPQMQHGGVVQYDLGKAEAEGRFVRTGSLNAPPQFLLSALSKLELNDQRGRRSLPIHLSALDKKPHLSRESAGPDLLFEQMYKSSRRSGMRKGRWKKSSERAPRTAQEVQVHYGTIASGNQVVKDAAARDRWSREFGLYTLL